MTRKEKVFGFNHVPYIQSGPAALLEAKGKALSRELPLDSIDVIEGHNPRGQYNRNAFDEVSLAGLVESIRERGVLTPLWVRPLDGGRYGLIAGERRYRAARQAELTEVPTLVFTVSEQEALILALLENAQREQLHIVEETYVGFKMMEEVTGLPREELIQHLNKLRKGKEADTYGLEDLLLKTFNTGVSVWSQRRAKVFDLTPEEASAVFRDELDFTTALALTKLPVSRIRADLLQRAIRENLSANQLKELVEAEMSVARTPLEQSAQQLRKLLPKLGRLEGNKAAEAARLLEQLQSLVD